MTDRSANPPEEALPPHVEETARAVEKMHVEHRTSATPLEKTLERIKTNVSAPEFIVIAIVIVGLWIGSNLALPNSALDRPPFPYLELTLSALAFFFAILILATQRRADTLAGHREQLILQLAFVSEQKTAKIIGLLEELRRDSPQLRDRVDRVAEEMKETVNPRAVSDALRDTVAGETKAS
jgi:uncharacterized membrane protein